MNVPSETLASLWEFIRGDTGVRDFEQWVYACPQLEAVLGDQLHMLVIETDYGCYEAVYQLKKELSAFTAERDQARCLCVRHSNLAVIAMGQEDDFFVTLTQIHVRGNPFWWLYTSRCSVCAQNWLVGQEERHNDVFIMKRLSAGEVQSLVEHGHWPDDFDRYETLLKIGRDAGHSVRYLDPLDGSLVYTVGDLAKARPGIRITELAHLLNVSKGIAVALVQMATAKEPLETYTDETGQERIRPKPWWKVW